MAASEILKPPHPCVPFPGAFTHRDAYVLPWAQEVWRVGQAVGVQLSSSQTGDAASGTRTVDRDRLQPSQASNSTSETGCAIQDC